MAIRFRCPFCNKKIQTGDHLADRLIDCPRCGQRMRVPPAFDSPPVLELAPPHEATVHGAPAAVAAPPVPPMRRAAAHHDAPLVAPGLKINFEDLIDMTAMVDIVFFLLIFFLVTSMHELDSTIPLPVPDPQQGGAGAAAADAPDSSVTVNIDRNDTIRIEGTEVLGSQDLLFKLRDLRRGPGKPDKLLVIGHGDASHGTAVLVLDAGHEVGFERMRMAVQDETE